MKPPEEFIKWLQAHPAVWVALQEGWEPSIGDWFCTSDGASLWLVVAVFREGIEAFNTSRSHSWPYRPKDIPKALLGEVQWLPTLGQLVRMLEKTECGFTLYSPDIEDDELEYTLSSYKIVDFDMDEELPEITCTALWAKVKGVEND